MLASIASAGLPAKKLGTVRDNRFHCVRYNQSVTVRNEPCGSCNLSCAAEDHPNNPTLQQRLLSLTREFRQRCLASLDRVIVTSSYLETQVAPFLAADRLMRIPNAPESLDVASPHMRGVAELPGINVLIVGMLTENKGQLQFVRHLDRLIRRVPSARVHLAGRGTRLAAKIKAVATDKGYADRVVFHGYVGRERLYELYRECQIVAVPVMWPEPFGRVPLEAAIARRPVVAFALGGLVESIVDGETGRLVEAGDFEAMLEVIQTLAERPDVRHRYGEAALQHVRARYDVGELKAQLTQAWDSLRSAPLPNRRPTAPCALAK